MCVCVSDVAYRRQIKKLLFHVTTIGSDAAPPPAAAAAIAAAAAPSPALVRRAFRAQLAELLEDVRVAHAGLGAADELFSQPREGWVS